MLTRLQSTKSAASVSNFESAGPFTSFRIENAQTLIPSSLISEGDVLNEKRCNSAAAVSAFSSKKYMSNKVNPLIPPEDEEIIDINIEGIHSIVDSDISEKIYFVKSRIQKQIKKVNAATSLSERMLTLIQLYLTINRNADFIKQEISDLAEVILNKSFTIIADIYHFIDTEHDLQEEDKSIMRKTISLIEESIDKLTVQ